MDEPMDKAMDKALPVLDRRPRLVLHGKGGGPKNEFFQDA
jgi:hypothetical protein